MAPQQKNRRRHQCFRAFHACVLVAAPALLAACSTGPVAWHSPGERSRLDTAGSVVFEGGQVLAARGDASAAPSHWRDGSLNIRQVDSQWKDAMWPERTYRRGNYRRFALPRNADTVLYFEQETYSSSSTQYRSFQSSGGSRSSYRGW